VPDCWFENAPDCPYYRLTEGKFWQCQKIGEVKLLEPHQMVIFFQEWRRLYGPDAKAKKNP
jgi:hypothetical protein